MLEADMGEMRRKSMRMGELFAQLMEPLCEAYGFALASPRDPAMRGSQIAYSHPQGNEIIQALREHRVIADFRVPDVLRFGLTPLYLRYRDIVDAVDRLRKVCVSTQAGGGRPKTR
jgi:kynureninase